MEIESEHKYSLTNSIWCLKETQTNMRQMMPKLLWQCHISKDWMSPGSGKIRLTTSDIMNSYGTNGKTSLAQSLLQLINSPPPYWGYMTSILMTSITFQKFMDGSLNSFEEATLQKNKPGSPTIKEPYPHKLDIVSLYPTWCLPPPLNGSRELWISTQFQILTERWTKVTKKEELSAPSHKRKFNELSITSLESLMPKTPKMPVLQLT